MSGSPTEAEIQDQWKSCVRIIEGIRVAADSLFVGAGGYFDVLSQALEGEYLPADLTGWMTSYRAGISSLVDPSRATSFMVPVLYEYGRFIGTQSTGPIGSGYRSPDDIFRVLYEWFVKSSKTVKSRAITYATPTYEATNTGNGVLSRLTVDENNFNLEACQVERKLFRCRTDQNSGSEKWAEVFEFVGGPQSHDSLLRESSGSGESSRTTITSKHAGSGSGGSLLANSTFSDFSATASPKFSGWTETTGASAISQDLVNYYRSHPGSQVNASCKMSYLASTTILLKQSADDMRVRRFDSNTPYFLRVMVNKTIGSAAGGNFVLRLGTQSVTTAISSLVSGWTEVLMPIGTNNWYRNWDKDGITIELEWNGSTAGYLLLDDCIFAIWDFIDGTYWCLRQNAAAPVAWLVDDQTKLTDTGGTAQLAKIQYWLWVSGYGYLPSSASPTFADP